MSDKKLQQWNIADEVPMGLFDEAGQWQSLLEPKRLPLTRKENDDIELAKKLIANLRFDEQVLIPSLGQYKIEYLGGNKTPWWLLVTDDELEYQNVNVGVIDNE